MSESNQTFLEAATNIGAKLCRDAMWFGNRCTWLGDSMEFVGGIWQVAHKSLGPDLYSGTSGVAVFLARLSAAAGEKLFAVTAEGAVQHAFSRREVFGPTGRVGLYSGLAGIAYALLDLGETLHRQDFVDAGLQIIEDLFKDDLNEQGLDVLSGCAGAIPFLLGVHRRYRAQHALDFADRCGRRLLAAARKRDYGLSWNTINAPADLNQHDLTGYSHGVAGIACALLELHKVSGDERYRACADEAFRYEQHWFNAEVGNWPDFRQTGGQAASDDSPGYMAAWCHGAPGIGLSRIRAFVLSDNNDRRTEAEAAIKTTLSTMEQAGFSLCHGVAGNAELLIYANKVLSRKDCATAVEKAGLLGIEQYIKTNTPWPCGVVGGGETPNLMLGIAGIGYFYLRLYNEAAAPSVLLITPDRSF